MRTRSLGVALVCTGTLLAGCGGDDAADQAASPTGTTTLKTIAEPTVPRSRPSPARTRTAKADDPIGRPVTASAYADDLCQALLDSNAADATLRTKLRAPKAARDGVESLRTYYTAMLDTARTSAVEVANDLRRAGSPRIVEGKELAADVRSALDWVDLVEDAQKDLEALEATRPAKYLEQAASVVEKLRTSMREQRADVQNAPDSAALDDAVEGSRTCRAL